MFFVFYYNEIYNNSVFCITDILLSKKDFLYI